MVSLGFSVAQLETDLHRSQALSQAPQCCLGAPAAPAVTPLPRGLEDPGVLMTFQSEVLLSPSCISGPELPV